MRARTVLETQLILISPRHLAYLLRVNPSTIYRLKEPEPIRLGPGLIRWLLTDLLASRLMHCALRPNPWQYTIPQLANALDISRAAAYRLSTDPRLQRSIEHFHDRFGRMRTRFVVRTHLLRTFIEEHREHRAPRVTAALETWTLKT